MSTLAPSPFFCEMLDNSFRPEPIDEYAVVSYIPGDLGCFITDLRKELVQNCFARSHVTILPPRPLADPKAALEQLQEYLQKFRAFDIELPGLEVFHQTSVIYAEITDGKDILRDMHETLNAGFLEHDEQYEYHPHVTLAQGLTPGTVDKSFCEAKGRWNKAAPARRVHISNVTFVQNTTANIWLDLNEFLLPERS